MKIRIGTDVKLTLSLNGNSSESLNIVSAKAYIINKSAKEQALNDLRRINQFITRFPVGRDMINPMYNGIEPDENNIHMLGEVPYHCYPKEHLEHKYGGFGVYPYWDKKFVPVIEEYGLTSYHAEVRFTEHPGVVEVFYPAEAQYFTGDYDVIIVAKVYQPGYKHDGTKTITVNFTNAFTLVPKSEDVPVPGGDWTFGEPFPIKLG